MLAVSEVNPIVSAMVDRGAPSHVRMFVGAGRDTWAGSPFVQERLALLGKTVFLLSFGFFVVINGMLIAALPAWFRRKFDAFSPPGAPEAR